MSDILDNSRHITFNGVIDTYYGLVMSGNTPIFVPKPKTSSVTVAYAHGTIDTSELDGRLYWEDISIEYQMACCIPTFYNDTFRSTDTMNKICADRVISVENWLYSGPATLTDTGWDFSLQDSECIKIETAKTALPDYWVIKFTITFSCPFTITMSRPYIETRVRKPGMRFIVYNGGASNEFGLDMIGATPLTDEEPKISKMDWPHRDGSLNLSHCRNGNTSGKESLFFNDRTITYKFQKFFSIYDGNGAVKTPISMNRECQNFVNKICCWLYEHVGNTFVTIDGMVTYGGISIMLADSAWVEGTIPSSGYANCRVLPSARVTSLNVTKTIHTEAWGLTFDVTFSAYPEFSSAQLYFPAPQEPTPTPGIVYEPWKHYADFDSANLEESEILYLQRLEGSIYCSFLDPGIYMSVRSVRSIYNGAGYRRVYVDGDPPSYYNRACGYNLGTNSLDFANFDAPVGGNAHFSISVDPYQHPSMEDYSGSAKPCLFLTIPRTLKLHIDGNDYYFIAYFGIGNARVPIYSFLTKFTHRKLVNGEVVESNYTQSTAWLIAWPAGGTINYEDCFNIENLSICYYYVNDEGFSRNVPFTNDALVGFDIDIPVDAHYIQRITGDDVLTDYGVYNEDEGSANETFMVCPEEIVFDYTGEELEIYYRNSVTKPFVNFAQSQAAALIKNPEYYRELIWDPDHPDSFPTYTTIKIPSASSSANSLVLCDGTKPPKGGDIQWL